MGRPCQRTGAPNGVGYGLSWWFTTADKLGKPRLITVPGAWGATPWIDRKLGYGGFFLVDESVLRLRATQGFFLQLATKIESLWA